MRVVALILLAASAALPAAAQPASSPPPAAQPATKAARPPDDDLIGSLLDPKHKPSALEEEEPDTAGQRGGRPDVEPLPAAPFGRSRIVQVPFAPAPRTTTDRPVMLGETDRTPDAPPGLRDMAYESRIRASVAAAEGFQGALDGGWTLSDTRGGERFKFQIVDQRDRLEVAWRDLRCREAAVTATGFADDIERRGGALTLSFRDACGMAVRLSLRQAADDRWTGQLTRGDELFDVVLRRTGL